jgi:hypothetical protein
MKLRIVGLTSLRIFFSVEESHESIALAACRRSGAPDARPAETGAGHGPVPANSLQGYSGRRRRDASVLDTDTLQDPIVAARRTWKRTHTAYV